MKGLGADRLFGHKSSNLVNDIDDVVKKDGAMAQLAYHTSGNLEDTFKVLQKVKGGDKARVASAPPLAEGSSQVDDDSRVTEQN